MCFPLTRFVAISPQSQHRSTNFRKSWSRDRRTRSFSASRSCGDLSRDSQPQLDVSSGGVLMLSRGQVSYRRRTDRPGRHRRPKVDLTWTKPHHQTFTCGLPAAGRKQVRGCVVSRLPHMPRRSSAGHPPCPVRPGILGKTANPVPEWW
jgi:hypothetical protein